MTTENITGTRDLEELRSILDGKVIRPGDPEYDEARGLWNGMIDKRPTAIVRARSEEDVQKTVTFASESNLTLAVRGGGHNVAGTASIDDGIVLDLSDMNGVTVEPGERRARVYGGATWADVDAATQKHGLATPGGVVSETGVGGLTLGGGIGHMRRKHGMTIDNLLGARIVTADGRLREVSERMDPELFWGLKGGGGNFGVVTSFEFQLHPVGPEVPVAFVFYDAADHQQILAALRERLDEMPEELSPLLFFGTVPEAEDFDEAIWGEDFLGLLCPAMTSDIEKGWPMLQPLRELAKPMTDMSDVMAYTEAQSILDDDYPSGELRYYWKSLNMPALTDEVIGTLSEINRSRPSPLSTVDVWVQGGAMARVAAEATAFGDRSDPYLIGIEANWADASQDEANIQWARDAIESLRAASSGKEYVNFPGFLEEGRSTLETAYGDNYPSLAQLKKRVDPSNLFNLHLNIEPGD